jgi:hypothetical protein
LGEFPIQKSRCRAHVSFLSLGIKVFTRSIAPPASSAHAK